MSGDKRFRTASKRALFIGGPLNGEWHEPTGNVMTVLKPQTTDHIQYLAPKAGVEEVPLPERVEYIRDVVDLFGHRLLVMVAYRELDEWHNSRSEALLKATLQRDVLAALGIKPS